MRLVKVGQKRIFDLTSNNMRATLSRKQNKYGINSFTISKFVAILTVL